MTVKELTQKLCCKVLVEGHLEAEVKGCTVCDLLSLVMANGVRGGAWITVQTHLNTIAVATLLDLSCIIIPHGIAVEPLTLEKAAEEGICMLQSPEPSYAIAGQMYGMGIK